MTSLPPMRRSPGAALTIWSFVALGAGLALGLLLHRSTESWVEPLARLLNAVGGTWIRALQVVVIPVVVTQCFVSVLGTRKLGLLGARSIVLFAIMLAAGAIFSVAVTTPLVALYHPDPATIAALRSGTPIPEAAQQVLEGGGAGPGLSGYVPRSLSQLLSGAAVLPLLVLTLLSGLAVRRLPDRPRATVERKARWLADATMRVVGWLLLLTPVGVLALCFGLGRGAGLGAAGLMTFYVLLYAVVNTLFILLLYPLTAALGRTSMRRFARAVAPAQLVASSTRSSMAALPALVEGGRTHLGLPVSATGFVLPLSLSTVKVSLTVGVPLKVVFLAHIFGLHVSPGQMVALAGMLLLLNFTTVGLPSGGGPFRTLPAYVAVGMPIEGVVILEAIDLIPDIFKTLVNVTADLSMATILTRSDRPAPP